MAAADTELEEAPPRKRGMLMPLILGLVLAVAAGGGGYWAVTSGPLAAVFGDSGAGAEDDGAEMAEAQPQEYAPVAFVALETLVVSLGPESSAQHLVITAHLEVDPAYYDEVTTLSPRVLDVMNSYLRVVGVHELSEPTSLIRIRAQLLRRIQVVTGTGRVRDLLITQFVVN